jgi:ribosome recycling factor
MSEELELIIMEAEERMEKTCDVLKEELSHVRTGRAHPGILEGVKVMYYGAPTPMNKLANVSAPEPRMLLVQPFDVSAVQDIENAIRESDLGLNPNTSDGKLIRVPIPELSEERRRELNKHVRKLGEDSKIAVRNVRREANDKIKKEDGVSEDDVKRYLDAMQKSTDSHIAQIDEIVSAKEKDLLTV